MGLFKKLKDILYDEEEYTEQIKITPEMRNEETPAKVVPKSEKTVQKEIKEPVKPVEKEEVSEREIFPLNHHLFHFLILMKMNSKNKKWHQNLLKNRSKKEILIFMKLNVKEKLKKS